MLGMNSEDTLWAIFIAFALTGYTIVHAIRAWRGNDNNEEN